MPRKFFEVVSGFAIGCSTLDHMGQCEVSLFVLSALSFGHSSSWSVDIHELLKASMLHSSLQWGA